MTDYDRLERIEKLIESNAKSIQALSEDRRESERDRARFYQEMANLSNSMANISASISNLSNAQADFYRRMEEDLSRRQGEIVEILKLLQQQKEN